MNFFDFFFRWVHCLFDFWLLLECRPSLQIQRYVVLVIPRRLDRTETTYLTCWQAVDILGHGACDKSRKSIQEGLHVGDK